MAANHLVATAIRALGSQAKLARAIGCSQPTVYRMLNGSEISAERAIAIERVTGGKVPRWKTRPDLFGRPRRRADSHVAA
jgi:DNA-binding transcriptional regulator YdaS (Cro superfamily)